MIIPILGSIIPIMGTISPSHESRPDATGLADALFGQVRQRVLGLLFGHPERSFYANEIIGRVDAGTGAVQRELARLESAGLVTLSRVGRQKHYQANPSAPIYAEVRGIVLKTSGLKDVLAEGLAPLRGEIRAAFVFGSLARGSATAGSDVDLMVISDGLTYADLFGTLEETASRLGRPVSPTIYSSAELMRRMAERSPFLAKVLGQPKIWIIGEEDDLPT